MKHLTAITWAIAALLVTATGLGIAWRLAPVVIPTTNEDFVIKKHSSLHFTKKAPFYSISHRYTLTYLGEAPIYVQCLNDEVGMIPANFYKNYWRATIALKRMNPGETKPGWVAMDDVQIIFYIRNEHNQITTPTLDVDWSRDDVQSVHNLDRVNP